MNPAQMQLTTPNKYIQYSCASRPIEKKKTTMACNVNYIVAWMKALQFAQVPQDVIINCMPSFESIERKHVALFIVEIG